MEVEDLFTDLADGIKLLKLLEIISGEKLGKPNNGRMRVHKIENVNKSLAFLHTKVSPRDSLIRKSSKKYHRLGEISLEMSVSLFESLFIPNSHSLIHSLAHLLTYSLTHPYSH